MPTYKIKVGGVLVDMPWNGPNPPSKDEIKAFVNKPTPPQDEGNFFSRSWETVNKPMLDYDPKMKEAMNQASSMPGWQGRVNRGGQFLADTVAAGTSPLSVGLGVLQGVGAAGRLLPRAANVSNKILKGAAAAQTGHGAYKVGEGLYKGDLPTAAAGALEGGLGLAGWYHGNKPLNVKAPAPSPIPEPPPIDLGIQGPTSDIVARNRGLALPPKSVDFFAGPEGNVVPNTNPIGDALTKEVLPPIEAAARPTTYPDITPQGTNLNVGEYAEGRRQANLPGMTNNNWQRAARGMPPQPPVLSTVGDPNPRPLASGNTSMGFQPERTGPMSYPYNVVPDSLRPRTTQNVMDSIVPDRMKGTPPVIDVKPEKIESVPSKGKKPNSTEGGETKPSRLGFLNDERGALFPNRPRFGGSPKLGVDAVNEVIARNKPAPPPSGEFKVGGVGKPKSGDRILQTGEKVEIKPGEPKVFLFNSKNGQMVWGDKSDLHAIAGQNAGLSPQQFDQFDVHGRVGADGTITYYRTNYNGDIALATDVNNKLMTTLKDRGLPPNTPVRYMSGKRTLRDSIDKVFTDETGAVGNQTIYYDNPSEELLAKMKKKGYEVIGKDANGKTTLVYRQSKPNTEAQQAVTPAKPTTQTAGNSTATSRYNKIPTTTSPVDAVRQWVRGTKAASVRGRVESSNFKDLTDESLIDKYEHGDRSGRLADVQAYFDKMHGEATGLNILKEDQKVPNYLRHEFNEDPTTVTEKLRNFISKNPSFSKTRKFPTYRVAEHAGLTRKFKTIPEVVNAYETKFNKAVRTRELFDYLTDGGHIKKGSTFTTNPQEWEFTGPKRAELVDALEPLFKDSPKWLKKGADIVSQTKNMMLAGGIPFTKYNMHALNVARSDAKYAGYIRAASEYLSDPTGKKALEFVKANEHKIPELIEKGGYTYNPVEDHGEAVNIFSGSESKLGKLADKATGAYQQTFETPLFNRALPALKLKRTLEAVEKLTPKLGREQAIKEASEMANDFYGGIEKNMRNKVTNDAARILFLAPDWLESRYRLAIKDYKGAAEVLMKGRNASEAGKIHAKSLARGAGLAGATFIAKEALSNPNDGKFTEDKPGQILSVPLGKDSSSNKRVSLNAFGTSDEGVRQPIEIAIKVLQGDPGAALQNLVGNKFSAPINAAWNVTHNQDQFGDPLAGKDKYGRQIAASKAIWNYVDQFSKPVQPQVLQGILKAINDKGFSWKEAASTAVEAPLRFDTPPKKKPMPSRPPRISMGR